MSEPIRVLCVFSTLDRGGAESMCMNLYRHIDRSKVQFDFVKHTSFKGDFEDEIGALGGRVFEAPRLKLGSILKYCLWWKRHLLYHPEHRIIHGHFFTISPIYFYIAKRYGRITVGHIHITKANSILKSFLAKFINGVTDYPLACSKAAGKWVYGDRPFIVLNNAIDTDKYCVNSTIAREIRKTFILEKDLVIGSVGRFDLQKNPDGILEIFRLVHEKRPDCKLLWIGDGPLKLEIVNKVYKLGLQDQVIFTGVRNDVNELLQAMDVFIMPSFYEGLPVSAIEAQAAGVRCFISDTVTKEVAITPVCEMLSLDDYDKWALILSQLEANFKHPDMKRMIINAGYDIRTSSKWLQDFYLSLV